MVSGVDVTRARATSLAALLAGAGLTHFAVPGLYDTMIPDALPGEKRVWTLGSGAVELGVAAAVLAPPTRRAGALAAADRGEVRQPELDELDEVERTDAMQVSAGLGNAD